MSATPQAIVGTTAGDLALRALGVVRLVVPVPFAAARGEVNVYLLDNADGSLTMLDTGFGAEAAMQALSAGFAAVSRRVDDVRRIILSHGHPDHFGAARAIRERTRARVLAHPRDATKILVANDELARRAAVDRYLLRLGAPPAVLGPMNARERRLLDATPRLESIEPLADGEELAFRTFRATVRHTPGHTPGHITLHAPAPRVLFSADQLLGHISPCPLIELGPGDEEKSFRALIAYLESLRSIEALDLAWILPGHGEPFSGHGPLIARLRGFYAKRQARLLALLEAGPRTPYELAIAEFGPGREEELFLMLSEIVGHLEVLEESGRVERIATSTPQRYRRR